MKKENINKEKSYAFSLHIIELSQIIDNSTKNYVLSNQILRSGTSIGANIGEAIGGQSRKDFRAEMYLSYKEARETSYWLRLLKDSKIIPMSLADPLIQDCCEELKRITSSILITLNQKSS